ncbi:MAG: hypothetical protein H7Y42_05050 [Chitinophagaceae bacterium]|nr:hypothetical protein [Chitinophagaceae bacterium]
MEPNQDQQLFGLNIEPVTKNHLSDAARWAKFLAIVGFIFCGLIVLGGIFAGSMFESMSSGSRYERFDNSDVEVSTKGLGAAAAVLYILIALLYFFPCLFLYNFANKIRLLWYLMIRKA